MTHAIAPLAPGEELIDAASFAAFWSSAAASARLGGAAPAPSVTPAAAAALEAEIDACTSRAEATGLAARLARAYADAAAVFVVHRGVIQGVAAEGCGGRVEAVLLPTLMPSVFAAVAATGERFRGAPPGAPLERRILRALGRESSREIAVLPAALGDRVVSLLYADNGALLLGDAAVAALTAVTRCLARAYARLILERRTA